MRHQRSLRKFGRAPSHRKALFRNLATSLLKHERVETTLAKAKDLRRVSEKLITLAKEDSLHRRRQALAFLPEKEVVHKLFAEIGPKFKARPGGYTRVYKTDRRAGDAAEMAIIELVKEEYKPSKKKKRQKKAETPKVEKKEAKEVSEEAAEETVAEAATPEAAQEEVAAEETPTDKE